MDVFAAHVIPELRVMDVQSLGQSCTCFRTMSRSLADHVWRRVAQNTFTGLHPVLQVDSGSILERLQHLAAVRGAVACGQLVSKGVNWPGGHSLSELNHGASQLLPLRNARVDADISLGEIDEKSDVCSFRRSIKTPTIEGLWENDSKKVVWSGDDQLVAVSYHVRSASDPRAEWNANGHFDVVYVVDVAAQSLQEATNTLNKEGGPWLEDVGFVPGCHLLFAQWKDEYSDIQPNYYTDVLRPGTGPLWDLIVRVPYPDPRFLSGIAFHPSGVKLALANSTCVKVSFLDGCDASHELSASCESPSEMSSGMYTTAWSASGDRLLYLQAGKTEAHLHVYDDTTYMLASSHALPHLILDSSWRSISLFASFSAFAVTCAIGADNHIDTRVKVQVCSLNDDRLGMQLAVIDGQSPPAWNADGTLVAVMVAAAAGGSQDALCIYTAHSGSCIQQCRHQAWVGGMRRQGPFRFRSAGAVQSQPLVSPTYRFSYQLMWARSETRIVVVGGHLGRCSKRWTIVDIQM